jgi:endonuclease/exonuclease/phosphatase (EEP) superfamily protein YafD
MLRTATAAQGTTLSVMTYNRGESRNQSLQPFKQATQPDVLLLQDAANRTAGYLRSPEYAEFIHGSSVGEFTILSKFPVKEARLLPPAAPARQARAARFVIEWQGRLVSIYSVHLMTPRDSLRSYARGAFLWGVLALPGTPWVAKRQHYQEFWDGQMADARAILDAVRSDAHPCVVAGDFNSPSLGYTHRLISRELGDSHMEAGAGFGFTFPGDTRNPLSLRGPWMRIDYVFHDRHWLVQECVTERDRPSQHRAVVAKLSLVSEDGPGS